MSKQFCKACNRLKDSRNFYHRKNTCRPCYFKNTITKQHPNTNNGNQVANDMLLDVYFAYDDKRGLRASCQAIVDFNWSKYIIANAKSDLIMAICAAMRTKSKLGIMCAVKDVVKYFNNAKHGKVE